MIHMFLPEKEYSSKTVHKSTMKSKYLVTPSHIITKTPLLPMVYKTIYYLFNSLIYCLF